jgi:hypothetical protein
MAFYLKLNYIISFPPPAVYVMKTSEIMNGDLGQLGPI